MISKIVVTALLLLLPLAGAAQDEPIYMSVLASRKHRHNASDNPVVGLFVTTDRGISWVHRGWREYTRMFYTEAGVDGTIWSACGNGILRSKDGGTSWRVTTGWNITEVMKVRVDPSNPQRVFAASAYGALRSTDGGENWSFVTNGFKRKFVSDILVNRADPLHVIAAGEEGIYQSRNRGESWSLSKPEGMANVLAQHPTRPAEFWCGTEERGLLCSTNKGRTWERVGRGLTSTTVYAIAFDPTNPLIMFVGTAESGVYRSTDGGRSWTDKSVGLGNADVHSLLVLEGSVVLAGTLNGGLYRSTDGGESWQFNSQQDSQVWGLSRRGAK